MLYLSGAESLASGNGYHLPVFEGAPYASLYPPGQSAFLALSWLINPRYPENTLLLKGQMLGLFALTMAGLFGVLRRGGVGGTVAALVALTVGLNPTWAYGAANFYSDIGFATLGFGVTFLWLAPGAKSIRFSTRVAATGIGLAAMYLTRTAGAGFLPGALLAVAVASFRRGAWTPLALFLAPVVLAVGAWVCAPAETLTYGTWAAGQYASHGDGWGVVRYLLSQGWPYLNGYHLSGVLVRGEQIFAGPFSFWVNPVQISSADSALVIVLRLAMLAVCVYGAWKTRAHRGVQVAVLTYVVQILVWPYPLGYRVFLVLTPLLVIWYFNGAAAVPGIGGRVCRWAGIVGLAVTLVINLALSLEARRWFDQKDVIADAEATGRWIQGHVPGGARLGSNFYQYPLFQIYNRSRHPFRRVDSVSAALLEDHTSVDYAIGNLLTLGELEQAKPLQSVKYRRDIEAVYTSPHRYFVVFWIHTYGPETPRRPAPGLVN